jgi:hypothetical protein
VTDPALIMKALSAVRRIHQRAGPLQLHHQSNRENSMNSNQRSEGNNQSNNGGNELDMNSARAGTADRNNIDPATQQRSGELGSEQSDAQSRQQQSGTDRAGGLQSGGMQSGSQQSGGQQSGSPSTDRQSDTQHGTYQETGGQPSGAHQPGYQNADAGNQQSMDRKGSQTDTSQQRQGTAQEHQSNDLAGGLPKSPAGNRMSADEKMNDDTGLSNTANREPSELDQNLRQDRQSNVGRRSDGTPD